MYSDFLKVLDIVKEAGEIFKEGFFSKKELFFKDKKDLLTDYDLKIEKFLKDRLSFLNLSFFAEESRNVNSLNNSIIIDPIDGTTNFVQSINYCAISVGIYIDRLVAGVVYNPITDEMFWAYEKKGAYLNNKKIKTSPKTSLINSLIATGFPYSSSNNSKDLEIVINSLKNILPKCRDIRRFGSASLDLCYVACGKFDGFYEINLKPWDVAAGSLIVKEAGGVVTNEKSLPHNMLNDKFIVASNGKIHREFIEILGRN